MTWFLKYSTQYMVVMMEKEEESLYSPSDKDSRKFGDGKPMIIWVVGLGFMVFPMSKAFIKQKKLVPFSSVSLAKL